MTSPPQAVYRQIADQIRAAILGGEYQPGGELPGEAALADRYGVSTVTVNRAIVLLRQEGLVLASRGHRATVRPIPVILRSAMLRYKRSEREANGNRGAFDAEIRRLGMTPRSEVFPMQTVAPDAVCDALRCPEGSIVMARRREMFADDTPVQLATSYIPIDIGMQCALDLRDTGPGGMLSRLAAQGYEEVRFEETVTPSRRADPAEMGFLGLAEDQFVSEIFHVGYTRTDQPVEVCVHVVPAYQWRFRYEWMVEDPV